MVPAPLRDQTLPDTAFTDGTLYSDEAVADGVAWGITLLRLV
jgi:hypothetical protein